MSNEKYAVELREKKAKSLLCYLSTEHNDEKALLSDNNIIREFSCVLFFVCVMKIGFQNFKILCKSMNEIRLRC